MIRKCPTHGYFRGDECRCGEEGKFVLDKERTERMGRFLSGALRHFPDDLGLAMNQHGWADIDVLVDVMKIRYPWASFQKLKALVESDTKGRYQIKGNLIRARYGHSIDIDLEMGIKPVRQRYVHLSTSFDKALEAASVHTDNPVIFKIDAFSAMDGGVNMMVVNEYIVLSDEIPPQYLEIERSQ